MRSGASSFSGADFCSDNEKPAANTSGLCKGFEEVWAKIRPLKLMEFESLNPKEVLLERDYEICPEAVWHKNYIGCKECVGETGCPSIIVCFV